MKNTTQLNTISQDELLSDILEEIEMIRDEDPERALSLLQRLNSIFVKAQEI